MAKRLVQRWQTRGGKYWYNLFQDEHGFTYSSEGSGGNLGNITEGEARERLQKMIDLARKVDKINLKPV